MSRVEAGAAISTPSLGRLQQYRVPAQTSALRELQELGGIWGFTTLQQVMTLGQARAGSTRPPLMTRRVGSMRGGPVH